MHRTMFGEKRPNDGHHLNRLSTHRRDIGVDVLLGKAHHQAWLSIDFDRRRGACRGAVRIVQFRQQGIAGHPDFTTLDMSGDCRGD